MTNEDQKSSLRDSYWDHDTEKVTEVNIWCSQVRQVWCYTRNALITQKELQNWLNQQRTVCNRECIWDFWAIKEELIRA